MKKIFAVVGVIVVIIVVIAALANMGSRQSDDINNGSQTVQGEKLDALRKCTVMEAADIYTTGIGQKSDNVFNDARETCESWLSSWGETDFINVVNEDWKTRKDEQIDGKNLEHYLDVLGW